EIETNSALVQFRGTPWRGLELSSNVNRTRSNEYLADRRTDLWTTRTSLGAVPWEPFQVDATYHYQHATVDQTDQTTTLARYSAGLRWRLTRSLYFRVNWNYTDDLRDTQSHDYLLSWAMTPKLSVSAQAVFSDRGSGGTERYNANANYELGRRITLYFSFSKIDFTAAGGSRTTTFQQGFRMNI
ncbi:MAG: porin, partial [Candidatus Eisenbacteria bacterium]|nr:porin [Candidatus Eisenbacteria bacterium]